jgi:hypothetical protein
VRVAGASGICAAGADTADGAASVGGAAERSSRVGAPSGGASSGLFAGPAGGGVVEVIVVPEVPTTGVVATTPAECAASLASITVPGIAAELTGAGARGPVMRSGSEATNQKSAIPAAATITVATSPRGRPSERRNLPPWSDDLEALAVRIGLVGVCCFGTSGSVGEWSLAVSGVVSCPGCSLRTFAPACTVVIVSACPLQTRSKSSRDTKNTTPS